ncbi:MAG: bifunctional 5,10-methylenetetrahydrofolate dehydrogenase/5,10-methenyltetrahydrofolate cyclohydrolase [Candidatus Liptonbacteria bacterium]
MIVLDGKKISEEILDGLHKLPKPEKYLAGVIVGQDAASESFQNLKKRVAESLGLDYRIYHLDEKLSQDELRQEIGGLAAKKNCGGLLVQLPLPDGINRHYVINAIPREKDVDVLGERAIGAFYNNRNKVIPPAVAVVEDIFKRLEINPKEKRIAVVGPGFLIGRPIALWLTHKALEVDVLRRGSDYATLKLADIVISGVGQAGLINPGMLKNGAAVIDFGYSKDEKGELVGDFDSSGLRHRTSNIEQLSFYTPTPGGTGPILVAKLMENFYKLAEEKTKN